MTETPITFPSTYGNHALDRDGHCHTRDPEGYVGHHRKEQDSDE